MIVPQGNNRQSDLHTLERSLKEHIPNFRISSTLNREIQEFVLNRLNKIVLRKDGDHISIFDSYENELRYFQTLMPVFNDQRALSVWDYLFRQSQEKTMVFLELLIEFEKTYEKGLDLLRGKQLATKQLNKIIKLEEALFQAFCECEFHHNSELMARILLDKYKALDELKETKMALKKNSYFNNGYCPLSRKNNVHNALPIFFIRKIYISFRSEFGSIMYSQIYDLISAIFNISWDHDEIKKHCKRMNIIYARRFGDLNCK